MEHKNDSINEHLSELFDDFDESTLISPNRKGEKQKGIIRNCEHEIEKEGLMDFSKVNSISVNELLLAALTLTLNKFNFTHETLIFNQHNVPFAAKFENRQISIREFLEKIHENYEDSLKYSISDELPLKPEFYYGFNEPSKSDELEYSNYLNITEKDKSISLSLSYNDELYTSEFIDLFLSSLEKIINQIISCDLDKTHICDIAIENENENISFSEVEMPLLHKRFEKQVQEKPDGIALVAGDATLTYNELNEKANRIANALINRGVKPKSNILIMLSRNSDLIASILGVLKAGCAFIPIDLEYPLERINYIYENSQADYIIGEKSLENSLKVQDLLEEGNCKNPDVDVKGDDLAYIIYTSGSTGKPKGVMITHKNVCNHAKHNPGASYASILSIAAVTFNMSLADIFTGLTNGLKLIFAGDGEVKNIVNLAKLIKKHNPEVMIITPSRLLSFFEIEEFYDAISRFKCIIMGGEPFSAKAFDIIKQNSGASVFNGYGQSEAVSGTHCKEITDSNSITIGCSFKNTLSDVRDIDGKLVPDGVMGELYIGGPSVGKGYFNLSQTKDVFIEINGIRYCRTGDFAVKTSDGEFTIKGRKDNQIKLRGLRIEIDEIKSNIGNYPNIKENEVVIKQINSNSHLCAYYTADGKIDKNSLKKYLADRLVNYMVPTVFMQLDEIPRNPNGKADLKRLPEPVLEFENVAPANEIEEKLFEIVSGLINTRQFGTTDELYKLGYTSLTLMKLNSLIYEEMGVNLDISILFDNPTIKTLAEEIKNTNRDDSYLDELLELSENMEYFPLTQNQLGIYYECMQSPDEINYTIPSVIRFDSSIDAGKLKEAIITTIESYPYLKTRIVISEDGTIKQKRMDDIEINEIEIIETESITDDEIIRNDVRPFNITDEQLFRFKIYKTASEIVLFMDFHHIITDGASLGMLTEGIQNAYENKEIRKEKVNGYAYSLIEKEIENSEKYEESKRFFKEKLSRAMDSTILPPNLSGNPDDGKIKRVRQIINSNKIKAFCKDNFISPNALFMSATVLCLNKYTFSDETLITTIFNGRADPNYYNTQGFLVKTLPFAMKNENRQQTIGQFINEIDKNWKQSLNNSYYPYTKIAEEFQLKPEFFFAYQDFFESQSLKINDKTYEGKGLADDNFAMATYKTNFTVTDNEDSFELQIEYNNQLYSEDYIAAFLHSIKRILNEFIENDMGSMRICDIELAASKDLPVFRPVETPFIHKRFENQVQKTPNDIALVAADETLTYLELDERANRVANALIKRGVKPKSNILVMLPRNSNLIIGIMGILKAGCAYIPIDLEYPPERIEYIYNNSEADYIIAELTSDSSIDIEDLLNETNIRSPDVDIAAEDTAYMIYTSGSTGNPKGVMIAHKNITSLFSKSDDNVIYNSYSKMNKILALSTVSFDAFLLDFMGLTFGSEIILANDSEIKNIKELTDLIKREKPDSLAIIVPSRLRQYLEYEEFAKEASNFKYIAVGGEMAPHDLIAQLLENPDLSLFNLYGPTEASVTCNGNKITDANNVTIGKALHNFITDIRDIDGKLLPQGVMGELYIGGNGVGKGYYNLPEKTKEVFLTINGIPYYRSGDYAIELANGDIDVKGRIDNQIKLRGLRIEIGEIESNISRFPNIKQTVVVIKNIHDNDHLCAYFTADEKIDIKLLKRYLKNKLTNYMVPTAFMQLNEMPQMPNGKTDIKQLPTPELDLENVKPENETEEKLFKFASEIIGTDAFGTTDDLYALGFTSLTLMKLNSMIFNETNVNIDIGSLFSNPTIRSLADKVDNHIESDIDIAGIVKTAEDMQYFPLTANQLGIYYECMQTDKIKYTMPRAIRFDSEIDPKRLRDAIIKTVESHPYLKTRIINTDDGKIMQKRCDDAEIDEIEIVEIDSISNEEIMERDVKAIPLGDNQLFRFKIYTTLSETILFCDFHHIITDGASQDNLFHDLTRAYNNEEIETEKIDGYAYSLIEEETSLSEVSKKFFKTQFSQGIESSVLTPNVNGNPDMGNIKLISDEVNSIFVRHFCQDHSLSPNVLFMTATILSLNKFTFSDKSFITTIFNGRANSNYFNTQGMLVKTLPIIVNGENRDMMIEDFLKVVDKSWKDALTHSSYPYTKLAEEYQLKPEFFYAYHEAFKNEIRLNDKRYKALELDGTVAIDYKINLNVYDDGQTISLHLEYNDQLYSKEYVEMFLHSIKYILFQFFTNDLDKYRLSDVRLKEDGVYEFSEVEVPFLHKRFEKQARETPNNLALIACDGRLTYGELDKKSNRVANALIRKGIKPNSNVLVMLPRTSNLISAILGVLKAGCAFIPIDIAYPKGRIEYIFENSRADYLIADGIFENSIDIEELLLEEDITNPQVEIDCNDLAYMIYTSGSTGKPKGVMTTHKNITSLFSQSDDSIIYDAYSKMKRTLAISTVSFDAFLLDFMPLTFGLEMVLASDDEIKNIKALTDLIKREKPDALTFTAPSRFKQYMEYDEFAEEVANFTYIGVGGEMVPRDLIAELLRYPDLDIYNIYGPTETTVTCNTHKLTDPDNITVGKALHNCITEVRDIDGKLLPPGIMGELYIGGYGVANGYYDMAEKTEEAFITINGIPYYKSGDYAIEQPNGELIIKGRIDNQIKLRGLRIEIGEIESNISRYPNIKQNVVLIKKINSNEHLCAYFTAEGEIDTNDLKEFLTQHLTEYMVPTAFMQIDEMPISPNGKTDIKLLPEPKLVLNYVAPETKLEQEICAIFSAILNIESVGAEDDFFEIGGTSLVASKLIIKLLKQGYNVRYDDIFRNKTPRALAKLLSGESNSEGELSIENDIFKNYNYSQINKILEENTLENFLNGEELELGNVLLTGVTGFLGIHILYELVKNESGIIYCMMRKGSFDSCEERLIDLMNYYFDEDFTDLIGSRIILSEGDITEIDDFKKLEDEPIDTIINSAAIVKHYTADDYIFRVNVDGVKNGLKFAQTRNNMRYVQISTLSVLSSYSLNKQAYPNPEYDERTLYYEQDLTNKYAGSKFLAERAVLEAATKGLSVKIMRVGNLMSRYSDGMFQKNYDTNAFLNNIRAIEKLKAINPVMADNETDMSQIDYVAKAVVKLSKTPEENRVFHCKNNNYIMLRDIVDALNACGYGIAEVSGEEFKQICEENMNENIQGIITADMKIDELDKGNDFYNKTKLEQSLEILHLLGFDWPKADDNYLKRVITHLNEVNFFD